MSFLNIAKEALKQKFNKVQVSVEPKLPVQDSTLPYGGRIGGVAMIDDATLLVAVTLGSIIDPPGVGEVTIKSISRVRMNGWPERVQVYRYYLSTGDDGGTERYIQVVAENGKPKEAIYFSSAIRLYPESPDIVRFYTGEDETDRIGGREWVFGRADLETRLKKEQLQAIGDASELVYTRSIGEGDYHLPVKGVETRIDDSIGDKGMRQKLWCMPHVRNLNGNLQEHLFVSLEVMDSRDGKKEQDVHVDFMIGIPISVNDFRIV